MSCKITYLVGDATEPIGTGKKFICHICNDIGAWGAGFVMALSEKWKEPVALYIKNFQNDSLKLGDVQYAFVGNHTIVCNMIAQHGVGRNAEGQPPIRYDALKECLTKVNRYARAFKAAVHMPRIGAGLAGGDWSIIEQIIEDTMSVDVFVYDLPQQ